MQKVFKPLIRGGALANPTVEFMFGLADRTNCSLAEVSVEIDGQPDKQQTPLVVKTNEKRARSESQVIADIAEFLKLIEGCSKGMVRFEHGKLAVVDYHLINGGHVRAVYTAEEPRTIMFQV